MSVTVTPTEADVRTALRSFLASIMAPGMEVAEGQDNRVPMPAGPDFIIFTPGVRKRMSTNRDEDVDSLFTGSIAGTLMTISGVFYGALGVGSTIFGVGVSDGTTVTALGTGSGGAGTYQVAPSQNVASRALAAGVHNARVSVSFTFQLDVYGPHASDNAQIIATLMRDVYACDFFARLGPSIGPLYADDPIQGPLIDAEKQYEDRWSIQVALQVNPVVSTPQQFADTVTVGLVNVDVVYPPGG